MNKRAVITGCNRGIGKAILTRFAENGYDIWACARKEDEEFTQYIQALSERTGQMIKPVYFDLSQSEQIKRGVKQILSEKMPIDVLINNAGVPFGGTLHMTSVDKLREVYEVNVFAQVEMIQLISRQMMRQKRGCIINMCSVGGIETNPGYLAYGSSKAALIWITRELARELGSYHIRVNGIAPGLVDTEMGHYKSEGEIQKVIDRTSLGRMGQPEEIAKCAMYLASDEADYISGHIMVIDGGRTCV